jgi:hypothetical protein
MEWSFGHAPKRVEVAGFCRTNSSPDHISLVYLVNDVYRINDLHHATDVHPVADVHLVTDVQLLKNQCYSYQSQQQRDPCWNFYASGPFWTRISAITIGPQQFRADHMSSDFSALEMVVPLSMVNILCLLAVYPRTSEEKDPRLLLRADTKALCILLVNLSTLYPNYRHASPTGYSGFIKTGTPHLSKDPL